MTDRGLESSRNGARRSSRAGRLAPGAVLLAMLLGGCGAAGQTSTNAPSGGAPSSTIVAGAPSTPSTTTAASTGAATESATQSVAGSQKPAILAVARRFADAYLVYQSGRLTPTVRHELRATCTPQFAAYLLASPVNIPPTMHLGPSQVTSLTYVPARVAGPQLALVHYTGGTLTVQIIHGTGAWRVTGLA